MDINECRTFGGYYSELYLYGRPSLLIPLENLNRNNNKIKFWDYYDDDRKEFERELFETYEHIVFNKNPPDVLKIRKFLRLCRIICNCSDPYEAKRIYLMVFEIFCQYQDSSLLLDLLDTTCLDIDMRVHIFSEAVPENLHYLRDLLPLIKNKKFDSWGLWPNSSGYLANNNVISLYFYKRYFNSIPLLLQHGIHWAYSEDIFVDYCKRLNRNW
ncbi:SOCS box domain-containing protein [Nephila pilipes]|nr:SOCS box domain-containing protein [Nephila pilipes]